MSQSLIERLFAEPQRFDFFQAVRLLGQIAREQAGDDPAARRLPVGEAAPPDREVVRFRALASASFPAAAVAALRPPSSVGAEGASTQKPGPPEMSVTFLGLTGPNGVLPPHYTHLLLQRVRQRDHTLRDFLDLFNHRILSLFYRAWEKNHYPFAYERNRLENAGGEPDRFTRCLYSLVGLGTGHLQRRQSVPDESFLFFGGLLAASTRTALSLQGMLADHFGIAVEVLQFQGQWLYLDRDDQSRLPRLREDQGKHGQLGVDAVVGRRVWDLQGKFCVRVGPLSGRRFSEFLPTGDSLKELVEMTRFYVGPELDFAVQLVLDPAEAPWSQVTSNEADSPRLGWNAWVRSRDFERPVTDAVFQGRY